MEGRHQSVARLERRGPGVDLAVPRIRDPGSGRLDGRPDDGFGLDRRLDGRPDDCFGLDRRLD